MEIIDDYTEHLVQELGEAKFHLRIWNEVNDHSTEIDDIAEEIRPLFYYVQTSALQLMVLKTARVFDNENSRYPTKCIKALFSKIRETKIEVVIRDETQIKKSLENLGILSEFNLPIEKTDCKTFLLLFISSCENLMSSKFKDDINEIKKVRDKYIAHNEADVPKISFDRTTVSRLTDFAWNIMTVITSSCFVSTIYQTDEAVNDQSQFIQEAIEVLTSTPE